MWVKNKIAYTHEGKSLLLNNSDFDFTIKVISQPSPAMHKIMGIDLNKLMCCHSFCHIDKSIVASQ